MNFKKYIIKLILLYFAFTGTAHAYLDPGTGSIILSTIIAFLLQRGIT